MKKLIFLGLAFLFGCGTYSPTTAYYQQQLQTILSLKWNEFKQGKPEGGGLGLRILSPKGNFFVSVDLGQNVTENIHFRSASTTKTFTAAAIMLLHQQGLLNIDDNITAYLPDDANYDIPYKDQITIRLLLEHRAGVFDISNTDIPTTVSAPYAGYSYAEYVRDVLGEDEHTFTFDELVGVLAANDLYYTAPDVEFHYSDTGYSILGKIVEQVSGLTYAEFIRDNFVMPNNLADTSFPWQGTDETIPAPYATGYLWNQGFTTDVTLDNMSPHVAEGNAITTPENLTRWIKALLTGAAGVEQTYVDMMMDVQATSIPQYYYGLGINYTPGLGYGHDGAHMGYLTVMRYDPDYDVAFIIFCSTWDMADIYTQLNFLYKTARAAREFLGYPSEG
ncbi:MAG: serine hydrolase domain-containing protein [Pseudomonadota bacterium]